MKKLILALLIVVALTTVLSAQTFRIYTVVGTATESAYAGYVIPAPYNPKVVVTFRGAGNLMRQVTADVTNGMYVANIATEFTITSVEVRFYSTVASATFATGEFSKILSVHHSHKIPEIQL